ncbi:9201_t:CDS:2 [Gigaspora margarita]|uniref:9201_t:CDS:1 n=1 Tax=Gigaspora margarita TaxID=4874 RepID=A0ABN7UVE0_GIGMA|nr:9201_t:CDS:2 [Gigaspora margarita]
MARQVVLERAYIVRIADEDGQEWPHSFFLRVNGQSFLHQYMQMSGQGISYGPPIMRNQWDNLGSQGAFGSYFWGQTAQNSALQNS